MDKLQVDGRERGLLTLSVCYLVWHLFSSAIAVAILAYATLAYTGAIEVATELPDTVAVLGMGVSSIALLACTWVTVAIDALAGLAYGVCALLVRKRRGLLGPSIILGRVMFLICVASVLVAFATTSATSLVSAIISVVLTGSLALSLRRFEGSLRERGESHDTPARTFVVDAADDVPAHEAGLDERERPAFRLVSGYASIMLAWGALRILMGLSTLFSAPDASRPGAAISLVVLGALIVVAGAYLVFVGRLGKRALVGAAAIRSLVIAAIVGVAASASTLVLFVVWLALGLTPDGLLVFSAAIDLLLYAGGLYYARRFDKLVGKKF